MPKIVLKIIVTLFTVCFFIKCTIAQVTHNDRAYESNILPGYKKASYAKEFIELKNNAICFRIFRRIGGWGWGEIYDSSGKFMAVLDHLGEILLRDQDIPMRLEADSFTRKIVAEGEQLTFNVKAIVVSEKLKGTSFDEWMHYPFDAPCIVGKVTITLMKNKPVLHLDYKLKATGNYYARYIRGPWLKVGESSFGIKKNDAILPGIDWAINDEWTSGTDFFKDPWALRVVPHPYKVTIPMMAISYEGTGIGLSYDPTAIATRWFNYRAQHVQPVFAAPNFVDRMNNNLMGLMIPDASVEGRENEVATAAPLELHLGQEINFDATIWLSKGNSVDVVTDWVKMHGLPAEQPRWTLKETLDKIANAYNTNLWHEGEGFGIKQRESDKIRPVVPNFLDRYISENKNTPLANALQKKINWCRSQFNSKNKLQAEELLSGKHGDDLIALQRKDGSFYFDPEGRHYRKDDFKVATSFIEPMGLQGETALDICMIPALELLDIAKSTGDDKYKIAAKKALDFCMPMMRPAGGDFWETPLHAPNLLAAGHAAIAYYEAFKIFNDTAYKQKAIYWIRTVLPFTSLWEPSDVKNMYDTKPCFSSSDWYFANWVRDHVQWEVLSVFAQSATRKINWAQIDPEIDWLRFHKGITNAAIWWMSLHTDNSWKPHNIPSTIEAYQRGDYDYCFTDTHNSTTGNYAGMFIMPEGIAANIYAVMDESKK